jgi:hypothetical protein
MDLPPGIIDFIDQYVSEALDATGTRKAARPAPPMPAANDPDTMIPIHIELEDDSAAVPPALRNLFEEEEQTAWLAPALQPEETEVVALPRSRAPRSSVHDIPKIDLDDEEITNLVRKPNL